MADRGYTNLLIHLNRPTSSLPLSTIEASIAHYLAHIHPSATPLAGIVVSSPLFRLASYNILDGLAVSFRHAVHVSVRLFKREERGLFSRGLTACTAEWVAEVLKGLQGGRSILRLACASGLLLGLADWEDDLKARDGWIRRKVEEEVVIALAEVIDMDPSSSSPWEREFKTHMHSSEETPAAALVIVSRALLLVSSQRLKALPLSLLTRLLVSTINDAFQDGGFIPGAGDFRASTGTKQLSIRPDSQFPQRLKSTSTSLSISHMASLSAMCTHVLSAVAETRPVDVWKTIPYVVQTFVTLTRSVEVQWLQSPLAFVQDEESLEPSMHEVAVEIWNLLKTLLFTSIRIVQSVLSVVLFVPPPTGSNGASAFSVTLSTLHALGHLAFVLPRFGGVSSTGEAGFPELKKAFYTALDILSSDAPESGRFIREARNELLAVQQAAQDKVSRHFLDAKQAYALACAEQLVPVLNEAAIRDEVYPLCAPHLNDPSHRETYESAHSVMLAVFTSHAKKAKEGSAPSVSAGQISFAEQIVPAYARCLVDNSHPDKLHPGQLRMAYRALVGSASMFRLAGASPDAEVQVSGDAYAWFCIELLLRSLDEGAPLDADHAQALRMALVCTISAVSITLLPKLLGAVRDVIGAAPTEQREELVKTLFEELLAVGDEEKEIAMAWWDGNKRSFGNANATTDDSGKRQGKERAMVARL